MSPPHYRHLLAALACSLATSAYADAEMEKSRGELLYTTHCIACHTTQVHWREQRLATDWPSLTKQVRRWQENTLLGWDDQDVAAVASYLNTLYYHFPPAGQDRAISRNGDERH